jgi:general stress protein 26
MDSKLCATIIDILSQANDLTLATRRQDGYPQATTVSYASDGLVIYFGCDESSQKAKNLARNGKVSLTVNLPYSTWDEIKGLSMAAKAERVTDPAQIEKISKLMFGKFPQAASYAPPEGATGMALFRVTPKVISILDYTKGFGHTDLVTMEQADLLAEPRAARAPRPAREQRALSR